MIIALPALYLIVAQLFYDIRKNKVFFIVTIFVLMLYIIINFNNTVNKFLVDRQSIEIRYVIQQQIINTSSDCSKVYSSQYYDYHYLRNRIFKLPDNLQDFEHNISSDCECPPKYLLAFGGELGVNYLTPDMIEKKEDFFASLELRKLQNFLLPEKSQLLVTSIYEIKDEFINQTCG